MYIHIPMYDNMYAYVFLQEMMNADIHFLSSYQLICLPFLTNMHFYDSFLVLDYGVVLKFWILKITPTPVYNFFNHLIGNILIFLILLEFLFIYSIFKFLIICRDGKEFSPIVGFFTYVCPSEVFNLYLPLGFSLTFMNNICGFSSTFLVCDLCCYR